MYMGAALLYTHFAAISGSFSQMIAKVLASRSTLWMVTPWRVWILYPAVVAAAVAVELETIVDCYSTSKSGSSSTL